MSCIITGMDVWDPTRNRRLHGDLYLLGEEVYVVNGVVDSKGGPIWIYGRPNHDDRVLTIIGSARDNYEVIERRGVVTVLKDFAILNDTAVQYLKKGR